MVWVLDLRLRICIDFPEYGTKYCMSTMTTNELGYNLNLTPHLGTVVNNAKPRIKTPFLTCPRHLP
jgi:hypothetical protein